MINVMFVNSSMFLVIFGKKNFLEHIFFYKIGYGIKKRVKYSISCRKVTILILNF